MKRTYRFVLLFFLVLGGSIVYGQQYQVVDNASSVKVVIKNAGMDVEGKLTGLEGEIRFNPADLKSAFFSVSVDASTINTGIDVRDENLRGDEYLDARKFPKISFVSKQVTAGNKPNTYSARGTLTIKGISREIVFPFTVVPRNEGLLFTGEFRVKRNDFKIGVGSLVLSETMVVSLAVLTKKG